MTLEDIKYTLKYNPVARLYRRVASRVRLFFFYLGMFLNAVFKNDYLMTVEDIGPWADEDQVLLHASFALFLQVLEGNALKGFWGGNWERKENGLKELSDKEFYKNKDKYIREHLAWASTLDGDHLEEWERTPHQAEAARVSLELYNWWTVTRPNRQNPDDLIDHERVWKDSEDIVEFLKNRKDDEVWKEQVKASSDLETAQYQEDSEMIKKLASIRGSLWT